ncbi:hypothetical protein GQR58_027847 [Nymphon striatum]|nr:hypothetical protein GQR58_027847 [Nymphon striatum]
MRNLITMWAIYGCFYQFHIMPTGCCVPICKNRSGHSFPLSNPARVQSWTLAINYKSESLMNMTSNKQYVKTCGSGKNLSNSLAGSAIFLLGLFLVARKPFMTGRSS